MPASATLRRLALPALLALGCSAIAPRPAAAMVRRTIQVDGDFSDWQGVLRSRPNHLADASYTGDDLDVQPDGTGDIRALAATWDNSHLYLYVRRTVRNPGPETLHLLLYIDTDNDGLLDAGDWILAVPFRDNLDQGAALHAYAPLNGTDPLPGDGVAPAGRAGPAAVVDARGRGDQASATEFEIAVTWVSLRVAAGSPLQVHAATAVGTLTLKDLVKRLPAGLRDNTAVLRTGYLALDVSPGMTRNGLEGQATSFPHTLVNTGNLAQVYNLTARNASGARTEFWTDPDRDGNPSDGWLLAVDGTGDGLFGDALDYLAPGADSDGDLIPDTGALGRGESWAFVLKVVVPAGFPLRSNLPITLGVFAAGTAVSELRTDTIHVGGGVSVFAPGTALVAAGLAAHFPHTVCNLQSSTQSISITATSALGWPTQVLRDGSPISGVSLPSGACVDVIVRESVPAAASTGTVDLINVYVQASGNRNDRLTDRVTVTGPLTVEPEGAAWVLPGTSAFYPHRLINATAEWRSFDLQGEATLASATRFWTDPDGNGDPSDGRPIAVTPWVEPQGGEFRFLVQVDLPGTLQAGDVDTTRVTVSDSSLQASVVDTSSVRTVATYVADPPAAPATRFLGCSTVHVAAGGIPDATYRFKWLDPTGALVHIGGPSFKDGSGLVRDQLMLAVGDPTGTWRILLETSQAGGWVPVTPGGSVEFTVESDLVPWGGVFRQLDTDLRSYPLSGWSLTPTAVLVNTSPYAFARTRVEHVVFQDLDAGGGPTEGEPYMQIDGRPASWREGRYTCRDTTIPLLGPGSSFLETACGALGPMSFPSAGAWAIQARWLTECADLIATRTTLFNVGCTGSHVPDAGQDRLVCRGSSTRLGGGPAQPGFRYAWSPPDYLDDPASATPLASPLASTTYGVSLVDWAGCVGRDEVDVLVLPTPPVNAGPSATICPGQSVLLGTPGLPGLTYAWSPATGLSSTTVAQPLATPASTLRYTLEATDPANRCSSGDTVEVRVIPMAPADAGPDWTSPARIGPEVCDATLLYSWSPRTGLDDPTACNPVANAPAGATYCLTTRSLERGCTSGPDCVTLRPPCPIAAPEAGPGGVSPVRLGPASCDPAFTYTWWPTPGLDDPGACNPVATTGVSRRYCLTLTDPGTGCVSAPDCAWVSSGPCPAPPPALSALTAVKGGLDVRLAWQREPAALGGYRVYRGTGKLELLSPPSAGALVVATAPSADAVTGFDPGGVAPPPEREATHYYRVVGVCVDGTTEGP